MIVNNNVSFGSDFVPKVRLNKQRWEGICPVFYKLSKGIRKGGAVYLVEKTGKDGKPRYYASVKIAQEGCIRAEDAVRIPNAVLGKWLAELDDKSISEKFIKLLKILSIRRQAIYDLRKMQGNNPIEVENIAERYLKRMRKFVCCDEEILVPKDKVYDTVNGIWQGPFSAKQELYSLVPQRDGHRIVTVV